MTDPFGTPMSAFVKNADLVGCALLIRPLTLSKDQPSTLKGQEGKVYDSCWADVTVLAGQPDPEKIPELPYVVDRMKLSGASLVPAIVGRFRVVGPTLGGRKNEFDLSPRDPKVPYVLGRLAVRKSDYNTDSWFLEDPTAEDAALARKWIADHPVEEPDPFAV